jgi:polysaccharide export outer membrane protein
VDRDGMISVPYAGRISVVGRTPAEISDVIVAKLNKKANEPQVIVTVAGSTSQSATVVGDVTGGGRVALNIKGDRLLEVISQAGGVRALPHETFITLNRGGHAGSIRLANLVSNPSENIFVYPGDTIYVAKEPQTFTALGAVTTQGDLPIDRAYMVLSDAVGKAGGLSDLLADKSAIFIFRWERADVVRRLLPKSRLLNGNHPVPVVYRLSFKTARGYFWARGFEVRNKDIVYVANAPTVEFLKFVSVIRAVASTARSIQAADPNTP